MNRVAVLVAASFAMLLGACAPDRSIPETSSVTEGSTAEPPPTEASRSETGENIPPSGPSSDVVRSAPSSNPDATVVTEVRDAKEAAEEAARKIFDATAGAAARIRDVGLDAVQAVRESKARKDEAARTEELGTKDADLLEEERVGS